MMKIAPMKIAFFVVSHTRTGVENNGFVAHEVRADTGSENGNLM